jgi:hypothetical protein
LQAQLPVWTNQAYPLPLQFSLAATGPPPVARRQMDGGLRRHPCL